MLSLLLLSTPPSNPTLLAPQFRPSRKDQIQLGKRAANEIRQKEAGKVLPASDPRVKMLRRIAGRILATFKDKTDTWEYSFDMIDSKEVNAFALPGGPTFFYTGLVDKMKTEDELAAVIGHELTHVRKEHWASSYNESQKRNIAVSLLLILTKANRSVQDLAGIATETLFDLPFSRGHELEADRFGYDAMVTAKFNPQGMVDTFETLRALSTGGKPPEFLSTHPDEKNRINLIKKRITDANKEWPKMVPIQRPTKPKDQVEKG